MVRLVTLLLLGGYVTTAYLHGGPVDALEVLGGLAAGVLCVWYPDVMGGVVSMMRPAVFRTQIEPEPVVSLVGWALLILPGTVLIALWVALLLGLR